MNYNMNYMQQRSKSGKSRKSKQKTSKLLSDDNEFSNQSQIQFTQIPLSTVPEKLLREPQPGTVKA